MDAMNMDEVKKKLTTFKSYNTYIYVRTQTANYNGYVLAVKDDIFMFADDLIPNPIPIRYDELKFMPCPSTKKGKDFNDGREGY